MHNCWLNALHKAPKNPVKCAGIIILGFCNIIKNYVVDSARIILEKLSHISSLRAALDSIAYSEDVCLVLDSIAEKALISHGLIPRRWASPYLDFLIVQRK